MYFKQNLRNLRRMRHISQNELAENLGYKSFTTVQKWEDGTSMPKMSILQKLADYFHVTMEHLINVDIMKEKVELSSVPVVGTVRTGFGLYAQEDIRDYEYVNSTEVRGGEYFYLDIVGDSMKNVRIMEGDRVYIRRQNTIENGQIAVVLLDNNEVTLKRVFFKEKKMILMPENDAYQPMEIPLNELEEKRVQILGKLIHNKISF